MSTLRQQTGSYREHVVVNGLHVNNLSHSQMASNNVLTSSAINAQNDDMCDEIRHGCFLEEFKEAKEVTNIIASLSDIYKDQIAVERALERFQCEHLSFVNSYQLLRDLFLAQSLQKPSKHTIK